MAVIYSIIQFLVNFGIIYWLGSEILQGVPNFRFWDYLRKEKDIDMLKKELMTASCSKLSSIMYLYANTDLKITYITNTPSILFPYAVADYGNKRTGILRFSKAYNLIRYQYKYLKENNKFS